MSCIIDQGAVIDCQNIPKGGVKKFVTMYNHSDWNDMIIAGNVTYDASGNITDIINLTGIAAFKFQVPDESGLMLLSPLVPIEGGFDSYDHQVNFSVVKTDQDAKNNISKTRFSGLVAVVLKNTGEGEVYGSDQGMKLITNNYSPSDPNLGGLIPVELKTSDPGAKETNMPVSIKAATPALTKTLIESLTTVGA